MVVVRSSIICGFVLASLVLSACGQSAPTRPMRAAGGAQVQAPPVLPVLPGGPMDAAPRMADPRVMQILSDVARVRDGASNSLMRTTLSCFKDDGGVSRAKSIYKFQKPNRVLLNILESTNEKVNGTRLLWTGGSQVQVKTKFVGFWVTVSLDVNDERIRDDRGYSIAQTSIPKTYETLLHPAAQVAFKGEGQVAGRPVELLNVMSPLSLKPTTREVYGIDRVSRTPVLREMYRGDKLIYRMQVEQITLNARFTSQDFKLD
jgi:hypothetical protein